MRLLDDVGKSGSTMENMDDGKLGIYRISAVKSHVDKFCLDIVKFGEAVDISQTPPHVLSNAVKLFFRTDSKLPQFPPCVIIPRLREVLSTLPFLNIHALGMLLLHLKLVTREEATNRMSTQSLAVIFTPTLMWQPEKEEYSEKKVPDDLILTDDVQAVALLIEYAPLLLGPRVPDDELPGPRLQRTQRRLFKKESGKSISFL
ncbi:ARHGAP29 [Cordylochernes scorpioides]|uniref:ARHGAP29 n=1 Tax=Cordylochernes scorpioides TaxID=51811 RepID=A0ABY6LVG8_9ARAC|nr:ARHGAP29 [Cordylochernes scorpioides]